MVLPLTKMWLNINGVDRMFICNPDKDSLADVIRRLGLTGTKVGCGIGVCGTCSVILNGKVVRSCTVKIRNVEEYSAVTTIEGIGTPNHLHPLQQAWITYGGVQCGFCSPGFIVSAYGLLQENINPTRDEVRHWFQTHRNICRCTGYKPLVDAVMQAAKVMRGECTMQDITYRDPSDKEYYGTGVPRPAALAKVCGLCDYGDDIAQKMPEGTLHLAVIQPRTTQHAKILKIDSAEAEKMPGVVKVITAKDVKGTNRIEAFNNHPRSTVVENSHPIFCDEKIFRYGDIVGLVVADTHEHARAAAAKVKVEIEQLPEYTSYLEAVLPNTVRVHDDTPNLFLKQPQLKGDFNNVPSIIDSSAHSVSGSFYSSREPHMSLEGDIIQAYFDPEGILTIHCKSQGVYANRNSMAQGIGLPPEKIRIVMNPTGASFGWSTVAASFAMAGIATMDLGVPVSLSMSYEEYQHFSGKRAPMFSNIRMGCDETGKITALEYDCGIDHGSYSDGAEGLATRPAIFIGWPYYVPNILGLIRVANTNSNYGVAYRGFGSPQAFTPSESIIDMLAEKAGIDPFEFRYRNIAREGQTMPSGYPFREYVVEALYDKMRPIYEKAIAEAKANSTDKIKRGVGLSFGSFTCTGGKMDQAGAELELYADGSVAVRNTWEDVGQGGDVGSVMHVLEALKPLNLTYDKVKPELNDTGTAPDSGTAGGSRSHMMNGYAIQAAARVMLDAMRKPDGTYRTYAEMKAEGKDTVFRTYHQNSSLFSELVPIDPDTGNGSPVPAYMYAVFLAETEVDVETGKTKVIGYTTVCNVGVVGNIISVDGQGYGGLSHCIGFALTEDYEGSKKYDNIVGSGIPTIEEIPDKFDIFYDEKPRPNLAFGSSGCSEMFQSGGHVAVINAIYNATGVRVFAIPATPQKVKAGLEKVAKGESQIPEPYFLGSDFYDEIEGIIANPVGKKADGAQKGDIH